MIYSIDDERIFVLSFCTDCAEFNQVAIAGQTFTVVLGILEAESPQAACTMRNDTLGHYG